MREPHYVVISQDYNVKLDDANDRTVLTAFLSSIEVMHQIPDTGRNLILSSPLVVSVSQDSDGFWNCHEPQLAIDGYGMSYWSAVNDFYREFLWLWDEIANRDSNKLDLVAQELKESMRAIVEEQEVEIPDYSARYEGYRFSRTTETEGVYTRERQEGSRYVSTSG
ncbi:MAG: hypothetical protein OXK81_05435 [Chloroflexota bacterium]|nr:hypothetical protein [Chloroflexota bacterium]MDE2930294.1 hypothetical protein [Chloroflexota bacterium]